MPTPTAAPVERPLLEAALIENVLVGVEKSVLEDVVVRELERPVLLVVLVALVVIDDDDDDDEVDEEEEEDEDERELEEDEDERELELVVAAKMKPLTGTA